MYHIAVMLVNTLIEYYHEMNQKYYERNKTTQLVNIIQPRVLIPLDM